MSKLRRPLNVIHGNDRFTKFNKARGNPGGLAEQLLLAARDRIFRDFVSRMHPSPRDEILDVGVSDVINDSANVLERSYQHQEKITACGLGAGIEFKAAYPLCRYIQIEPNTRLPFGDNSFDIATSNAVLEHVGSYENQMLFVKELCRVANRVFVTVPNRFFPIEHHTALPLVPRHSDFDGLNPGSK